MEETMGRWSWSWGWTLALGAGCAKQWDPQYALGGARGFAEMRGPVEACDADLLAAVRASELELEGRFPPFGTQATATATAHLLGAVIPLVVEPAERLDAAHARPADPDAWSTTTDGHAWRIVDLQFGTRQSCGPCEDQVVVRLDVGPTCEPWPVYR